MHITLSPARYDYRLLASVKGDTISLAVGGDDPQVIGLAPLPEGAILPAEAIGSEWIIGSVARIDGEIHLTLRLPHGPLAPHETRFPEPIHVTSDGPVDLPDWGDDPAPEIVAVIDGMPMDAAQFEEWKSAGGVLE